MSVEIRTPLGTGDASAFESLAEVGRVPLWDTLETEAPGQFERLLWEVEAAVSGSLRKLGGLGVEWAAGASREGPRPRCGLDAAAATARNPGPR